MKQVLQTRSGETVVRDVPAPPCERGSVIVRNAFSAISSGTERARVELSQKSLLGKARERPDLVREVVAKARREGLKTTREAVQRKLQEATPVGYSSAGRVLEIGDAVGGLRPGDLVACAGGGHANHAEIVSVPRNLCAKVPVGVPLEAAALSTIGAIALHGVRLAGVALGERVAVVGCGLVGQIAVRLLHAAGAIVYALDLDPGKAEAAREGGADAALRVEGSTGAEVVRLTGGIGVDAVVITAAAPVNDPLLLAAEIARDRGSVVLVGDVPIQVPRAPFYDKELAFRVSRSYGPGRYDLDYEERGLDYPISYVRWTEQRNMECVLDLQSRGLLRLTDLIDDVVPVDEAERAYERLAGPVERRPRGALVLAYPEAEVAVPAPSRRAPRVVTAAEGQVRIGLVGPGGFAARILVPALLSAGAQLELVGGGSGPSAEAATRTLGFTRMAESAEALIEDPAIEAVVIATRHGTHADLAARALEAGKHVFCEKPIALDVEELTRVLEAASRSRGILAVGFNRRFAPQLRELRAFVRSDGVPVTASYRVSAGKLPKDHWTHDLDQGGGRLVGEGCHFVDSLAFIAASPVTQVHAAGHGPADVPVRARDNLVVTLTFADGSLGTIAYIADGSPRVPKERLEAFSGSRTAILEDYLALELFSPDGRERKKLRTQDKGHREEIRAFVEGVRRGEPPVPLTEIENVHLATFAAVESLRSARAVPVMQP